MSKDKKKIYKPSPISGFPEWLPEVRMVEQQWLDHIRKVFESYGFCSIETPAVEELAVIAAKGEDVDKEIYTLERLQADENEKGEARLALHFDQTVPFARYVAMHFNDLVFPFKRYQMQKVWRGERPQAGRMREFYQCDIDVINPDNLPITFDAEMPAIIWEVLSSLPGMENENIQIRVSTRKILIGLLQQYDFDFTDVLRLIDKREKMSIADFEKSLDQLHQKNNSSDAIKFLDPIKAFLRQADKSKTFKIWQQIEFLEDNLNAPSTSELTKEGLSELIEVLKSLSHLPEGAVVADLSIVRGLDYYTGTVYETVFVDDHGYGSICSGGRYDDLAGSYINKHLPGVGISIGFSRLFDRLRSQGKLPVLRKCPTDILILPPREEADIPAMKELERSLRGRGFNVEIAHGKKLQKQMGYAEKKGIPFVWFAEDGEVKNMDTGEQVKADPEHWNPERIEA
ncbi:MAG: histidine--tRNA ligase [Alphaproteobacteria bacterium]